jgi:hypothetical protein
MPSSSTLAVPPARHLLRAKELKGRGVEFQQEPTEQPYGVDAGFRDPSGNQMRMVQEVAAPR